MVYAVRFVMAVSLLGSAVSAAILAAAVEPAAGSVRVVVDIGETPDLAAWADDAKRLVLEWHPKIVQVLGAPAAKEPVEIRLVFRDSMKGVAATTGNTITIAADWVRRHPEDRGMVVHELTHAVQAYPRNDAGWLVEGIADYVRFYHFEPQAKLGPIDPARQTYRDGYRTGAMLLAWIEATHGKDAVRKLNEALRTSRYRYELFRELTGKSLDRLWADFLESDAARGRAT
ncbi:MAG: basic secretory protein-like protein [Pirellulales bacterium]